MGGTNSGTSKKKLQKFGTGDFARGQIREPQKKKLQKFGTGYFARGQIREPQKKNCRSLARVISHGDKFGNLKKKLQKFGTGYFARGQIREPHRYLRQGCSRQKRQCMALAPGM